MQSIKPALIAALIRNGSPDYRIDWLKQAKDFVFDLPIGDRGVLEKTCQPALEFAKQAQEFGVFRIPFNHSFYQIKQDSGAIIGFLMSDEVKNGILLILRCSLYKNEVAWTLGKDIDENERNQIYSILAMLTGLLRTKGVPTRVVRPSRQERRAAERKGTFTHEYTVIDLTGVVAEGGSGRGIPANRRLHWRRGHFRRLASGKITSVAPCLVGDKAAGFIEHDYTLRC